MVELKDLFGKPGEGVHKYRIFGIAAVDLIATIILALIIVYFFMEQTFGNVILVFLILFILGQFLHYFRGVQTAFLTKIGLKAKTVD